MLQDTVPSTHLSLHVTMPRHPFSSQHLCGRETEQHPIASKGQELTRATHTTSDSNPCWLLLAKDPCLQCPRTRPSRLACEQQSGQSHPALRALWTGHLSVSASAGLRNIRSDCRVQQQGKQPEKSSLGPCLPQHHCMHVQMRQDVVGGGQTLCSLALWGQASECTGSRYNNTANSHI